MVIDTSALVAIVLGEPEAADFDERTRAGESRQVSVATWVELTAVLSARGWRRTPDRSRPGWSLTMS